MAETRTSDGKAFLLPSGYPVPVHRYRKEDVSALLKKQTPPARRAS